MEWRPQPFRSTKKKKKKKMVRDLSGTQRELPSKDTGGLKSFMLAQLEVKIEGFLSLGKLPIF